MNIRNMELEELEKLSHLDIAYYLIKEDKEAKTTIELLKEICSLLKIGETQFKNMIGDFYTSLTVDKRFLLLEDGKWDLKENHSVKIVVEDELDELEGIDVIEDLDEDLDDEKDHFEEESEEIVDDIDDLDDLDDLDDIDELDDLTLVDEENLDSDEII